MPVKRLVLASNRLPVVVQRTGGELKIRPGSGGLVTAMAPVLRDRGGIWIGWPGVPDKPDVSEALAKAGRDAGYDLKPVTITAREERLYYRGFSNEVLWPLFHDLITPCRFDPEYRQAYLDVNRKFAEVILKHSRKDDFAWIHDYHLIATGRELRRLGYRGRLAFFLHTPFPPADVYLKLPWRRQMIEGVLQYDLVGFQTLRDRTNFLQCIRKLYPEAIVQRQNGFQRVQVGNRRILIGNFPIGIDYEKFAERSEDKDVQDQAGYIHEELPDRQLVLGVDRLDYTKGIPHRLRAYYNMLKRYPKLRKKVSLIQVVVPSRDTIVEYKTLREEIEQLVSRINGEFTRAGWVPVHYMFRSVSQRDLIAYYRAAEVALVTPLKDGMNLVAKEYCAASSDENGVLILSEFAGAAEQLGRNALLVNPYDVEGVADAIHQAVTMPQEERRERMRKLRQGIRRQNIFGWVDSILQAGSRKNLQAFPVRAE